MLHKKYDHAQLLFSNLNMVYNMTRRNIRHISIPVASRARAFTFCFIIWELWLPFVQHPEAILCLPQMKVFGYTLQQTPG